MAKRAKTQETAELGKRVTEALLKVVGDIPRSKEEPSENPAGRAEELTKRAALDAAVISGGLALPAGPLALLTLIPDLLLMWKRQAKLVADMAAAYGKSRDLSQNVLLYCLFRHTASEAVRTLTVPAGDEVVLKRSTVKTLKRVAAAAGVRVAQRLLRRQFARVIPVLGIVGVAGYAYYDTAQVGETALEFLKGKKRR
ncbi:MAG: hypothetical protein WC728_16725 [Elusimicrobiota bacterium]